MTVSESVFGVRYSAASVPDTVKLIAYCWLNGTKFATVIVNGMVVTPAVNVNVAGENEMPLVACGVSTTCVGGAADTTTASAPEADGADCDGSGDGSAKVPSAMTPIEP